MNSLTRSVIAKAAYDNGWEVTQSTDNAVIVSSALHPSQLSISGDSVGSTRIYVDSDALRTAAESRMGECVWEGDTVHIPMQDLSATLRILAELDRALPDLPMLRYQEQLKNELEKAGPVSTEVERTIKARVGQNVFRQSLMDYWGGACAVTGITTPELLRASHIKPWAQCDTDQERLNVFNGLLLAVHIDALFDKGLATFAEDGRLILAESIPMKERELLNLGEARLRWITARHQKFLQYHRQHIVPNQPGGYSETCAHSSTQGTERY